MKVKQGYMAYVSLWIPLIWGVKVLHISLNFLLSSYVYTVCCKLFKVEKFHSFRGLVGNRETFPVK